MKVVDAEKYPDAKSWLGSIDHVKMRKDIDMSPQVMNRPKNEGALFPPRWFFEIYFWCVQNKEAVPIHLFAWPQKNGWIKYLSKKNSKQGV